MLKRLERELLERGCPEDLARRHTQEMMDHREDLISAALQDGVTRSEAESLADARLGDPGTIANDFVKVTRQARWWGRHPFVSFCVLPPVSVVFFLAIAIMALWCLGEAGLSPSQRATLANGGPAFEYVAFAISALYHAVILVAALLFSSLARRCGYGLRGVFLVCAVCALQGYFSRPIVSPHSLSFGYGTAFARNWTCALLPLALAGVVYFRQRSTMLHRLQTACALVLSAALAIPLAGCKSHGPAQRGWIGGEYKLAKSAGFFNSDMVVPAIPKGVDTPRGLLVTAAPTNTPAHLGGLQPGDLIVKVNAKDVSTVREFTRVIDSSAPGINLPLTVYRDGNLSECQVQVGRETYRTWHTFGMGLFAHSPDLWPDPGFSLIFLGYQPGKSGRQQLHSVENSYLLKNGSTNSTINPGWDFWAGIVDFGSHENVLRQETFQ